MHPTVARKKTTMDMQPAQLSAITNQLSKLKKQSAFYAKKFKGIDLSDIKTQADFEKLPFTDKADPEMIRAELRMTKNQFKRAVGRILKEEKIEIGEQEIRLL